MQMFRLFQTNSVFCLHQFLPRGGRISRCEGVIIRLRCSYFFDDLYTLCLKKNRTLVIFSNISNKSGPILIIFGTENRQ